MTNRDYTLWAACVRTKSFEERLKAAHAGNLNRMTIFPLDVKTFTEGGLSYADMRHMIADSGVKVITLDPFTRWTPHWQPPEGTSEDDLAFVDFDEDTFFRIADELRVDTINLIETFGNDLSVEEGAENFARVCDRARDYGWRVHLEFMPFSSVPDLATAWEIVQLANRDNGGITLDTWHYYRGNPDHELLRTIPGEKIFALQVADADEEVKGDLQNDLLHFRKAPGEGDFDLATVINILAETGGLNSVGVEVFADAFDELSAVEAGERAGESLRGILANL